MTPLTPPLPCHFTIPLRKRQTELLYVSCDKSKDDIRAKGNDFKSNAIFKLNGLLVILINRELLTFLRRSVAMLRGKSHKGCIFFKLSQLLGNQNAMDQFNYIDAKEKCRHLKKLTCKGTLRQMYICLRPPPLLGFCLGWSCTFWIWSDTECWTPAEYGLQQDSKPSTPLPATHYLFILYLDIGGGGGLNQREDWRCNSSQSWSKIPTWLALSPVYKLW